MVRPSTRHNCGDGTAGVRHDDEYTETEILERLVTSRKARGGARLSRLRKWQGTDRAYATFTWLVADLRLICLLACMEGIEMRTACSGKVCLDQRSKLVQKYISNRR